MIIENLLIWCRWDEWVADDRMMKLTEENLKRREELVSIHLKPKPAKSASSREEKKGAADRGKKRQRDSRTVDTVEDFAKRPEVRIAIPEELKARLVDDWENVTKNQKVCTRQI